MATATMARGVEEAKTTMMTAPGEAKGRAKAKAGAKGMTLTVTERGVASVFPVALHAWAPSSYGPRALALPPQPPPVVGGIAAKGPVLMCPCAPAVGQQRARGRGPLRVALDTFAGAEKGRWRRRILCSDGTILICRTFSASIFWI